MKPTPKPNFDEFFSNPDDFFSDEETERRMSEAMRRLSGQPRQMNMKTGQNLKAPFLSEADLAARGYPCDPGFE
jgi:hypothetical protein